MENLSLKNILWIIFGFISGYVAGQVTGGLLAAIFWTFAGLVFGGLAYQATSTIIINAILSVIFGVLLSHLMRSFDKMLFGSKMSFLIWGVAGAIAGLIVMFTYGINIILHPEVYGDFNGLNPIYEEIFEINRTYFDDPYQPPWHLSLMHYGAGTGQLIGVYLGIFAGLFISIRETVRKKRKAEDKKEFNEYSNFFKERLKK